MRTRAVGAILVSVALIGVVAPSARAENDPFGVVKDPDGVRWVTMTMGEFQALPAVSRLQSAMVQRASGDFRAGDDSATDDDPHPLWTVVQDGSVTRVLERNGSTRTIRYVGPDRECVRTAPRGTSYSIGSDARADFACRARRAGTWSGREYVRGFLPSALSPLEASSDSRVLVRESDLVDSGSTQMMSVAIREVGLLRTLGVYGGPGVYADYEVTPTGIWSEVDVSNGISWSLREFMLTTRGVPDLPRSVARQVR